MEREKTSNLSEIKSETGISWSIVTVILVIVSKNCTSLRNRSFWLFSLVTQRILSHCLRDETKHRLRMR